MIGKGGKSTQRKTVSVLFNEPKLLKCTGRPGPARVLRSFSALQRAEIAEIEHLTLTPCIRYRFSALQRAEIAEIHIDTVHPLPGRSFSALQRAEIAEIPIRGGIPPRRGRFQCSSTSRNC